VTPLLSPPEELGKYFREGPYSFEIRFGRGTFAEFYAPTRDNAAILAQRRELLRLNPERHLARLPEGDEFLSETVELAIREKTVDAGATEANLGARWEPDFLLLKREAGSARLVFGCVCFPSSWNLAEKTGRPIEEIHEVVPGLNAAIGRQIGTFLERLKPGVSWTRSNWGLSRHPDLNQHPALGLKRLDDRATADEIFFRVEDQSLLALPRSGGILFGIRIKVFSVRSMIGTEAGAGLARALETMPEEMARYKGLAAARGGIVRLLRARS
jgi:dimethylamine monooxygenase subunit A